MFVEHLVLWGRGPSLRLLDATAAQRETNVLSSHAQKRSGSSVSLSHAILTYLVRDTSRTEKEPYTILALSLPAERTSCSGV